jgi:hypothetical protein
LKERYREGYKWQENEEEELGNALLNDLQGKRGH